jgi:benzoyl-CoA reductase/2-hydroxyglutaryl-CoA dehydratase subunit BcrC/BadD/HgdB
MPAKIFVARYLYKAISSGWISFNSAARLYGLMDFYFSRAKPPSGRFSSKLVIRYLREATSPGTRSAWTSILFPAEMLYAFGVYPITLEVISGLFATLGLTRHFLNASDENDVPATMCSFHRMLMGISNRKILGKPSLVGATSLLCDGNLKSFGEVAKEQKVPFIFIDIPNEDNKEAVFYVKEQLSSAMATLSKITGIYDYEGRIRAAAENVNKTFDLFKRFYELQKTNGKNLFCGYEIANFCFPHHFMLGSDNIMKILEKRCEDIESGKKPNSRFKTLFTCRDAKRLMWLHITPQYDTSIWDIIDDGERARIVCDEYSSVLYEPYDLNDPLNSIAKRLIRHPSNGPIERRLEHIIKTAKDFKVDGIIHYSSWGCHQASGNVYLLGKKLESAGFRFINLNGDPVDPKNSSLEQHRTRLEAFLENW